ncbi:MAG: hypothetical protein A2252_08645 [Elusimicrobia bacterium RIFOXYA2_FULL_39_19]|nr:MAG: hypothetical protein A2252_08645 [Elusimicrobia bacterium RIFOXYA2_FULL_39_19]
MNDILLLEIIQKAKNNDLPALEFLCAHFYNRIYNYIHYKVDNSEDAKDLTNEVFVRMVKSIASQSGDFKTWLYKIAANLVIDFYRQKASRKNTMAGYEEFTKTGISTAPAFESLEYLEALNTLTEEQKEVVRLRFAEGFDTNEIAEILQKTPNAVKALQFRAMEKLKAMLKDDKNIKVGQGNPC